MEGFVEHGIVPSHSVKECRDPGFYLEFGDEREREREWVLSFKSKLLITFSSTAMVFKHLEGMDTLDNFGVKVNPEGP